MKDETKKTHFGDDIIVNSIQKVRQLKIHKKKQTEIIDNSNSLTILNRKQQETFKFNRKCDQITNQYRKTGRDIKNIIWTIHTCNIWKLFLVAS